MAMECDRRQGHRRQDPKLVELIRGEVQVVGEEEGGMGWKGEGAQGLSGLQQEEGGEPLGPKFLEEPGEGQAAHGDPWGGRQGLARREIGDEGQGPAEEGRGGALIRVQMPKPPSIQGDHHLPADDQVEHHVPADPVGDEERVHHAAAEDVQPAGPSGEVLQREVAVKRGGVTDHHEGPHAAMVPKGRRFARLFPK